MILSMWKGIFPRPGIVRLLGNVLFATIYIFKPQWMWTLPKTDADFPWFAFYTKRHSLMLLLICRWFVCFRIPYLGSFISNCDAVQQSYLSSRPREYTSAQARHSR